jgi:hypothetical protein
VHYVLEKEAREVARVPLRYSFSEDHENLIVEGTHRMLRVLSADAIFIAAVLVEIIAALSLLQSSHAIVLREEFEPVLGVYRGQALPFLAAGANAVWPSRPQGFADASLLAGVFFFLFFIAQARNAMAPYDAAASMRDSGRAERLIDWALPVVLCIFGAFILAPTLLAFLTMPAALFLGVRRLLRLPSWFEVSQSYYVNLLCIGSALLGILSLQS